MGRRHNAQRLFAAVSLVAIALMFSGCDVFSSPQNTFAPEGEVAKQQRWDFMFVMWPALVIMILVLVAVVVIPLAYRRKKGDPGLPKQIHGNTALELAQTILPVILLAIVAVPTLNGIQKLAERQPPEALTVNVIGIQWAWQFEYPEIRDADEQAVLTTADMYIPVGERVELLITSLDVNHSFWIPKLAGKTDAIQNHPNHMWIQASKPGIYEGQCAEFCGLSHSEMRMRVHALSKADWEAWIADQDATFSPGTEPPPPGGSAEAPETPSEEGGE